MAGLRLNDPKAGWMKPGRFPTRTGAGVPLRDGSGGGVRANIGRGGCVPVENRGVIAKSTAQLECIYGEKFPGMGR